MKTRIVPSNEIASCPKTRLDAAYYIPAHKTDECGAGRRRKKRKDSTVKISVQGGVVTDIENLPEGLDYEIIDHDI